MNGNGKESTSDKQVQAPVQVEVPRPGLLRVIWQRRWIVFAAMVVCLGAGLIYLTQATPIYVSLSRLYVEQSGPRIISEAEGVMTRSQNYLYTQCELLVSTPILASALEQPGVRQMETFASVDNPIAHLRKAVRAGVGKKDDIISVLCESPYPEEAARIVNAVVDAYVTYHAQQKRSTAAEVLKILQKEKVKRDAELTSKLKAILKFQQDNSAFMVGHEQDNIIIQQLSKLSDALATALLQTVDAKAAYEAAKAMMGDPAKIRQLAEAERTGGAYASTDTEAAALRQQLRFAKYLAEERGYGEGHPAVLAAQARAAELEGELADREKKFAEAYLGVAQQRYLAAEKRQEQLQASFDQQQKLAQQLNVKAAEYAMLQSELRRTERLCDILDTRIKEINVTEDTGALNISILEVAKPAAQPSKPEKARAMVIALVLGLMLGVGSGLLRDWMDQRLRSAEDISATLGTPVLGVVPHIGGKHDDLDRGQRVRMAPKSRAAEAYRTIRTAVYFGAPDGQAKTLLVTSPGPGDGKTTLVSNLGIAMAQAGQRTLILDADFRKPMQHAIFDVNDEQGLSNVLAGKGKLDELIRPTEVEGLDILPCGPVPPNPSEMLNSQSFAEALAELSERYDHVLLDSPPITPVADARILGAMCDVTMLVLRAEKSTRRAAEQARGGLLSVGAHILGAIVNDVPRRSRYGYYGYYGGYGYYYGYGYGRKSREKQDQGKVAETEAAAGTSGE